MLRSTSNSMSTIMNRIMIRITSRTTSTNAVMLKTMLIITPDIEMIGNTTKTTTMNTIVDTIRVFVWSGVVFAPRNGSKNEAQIRANKSEGALSAFRVVGPDFVSKCGPHFGVTAGSRPPRVVCSWLPSGSASRSAPCTLQQSAAVCVQSSITRKK